MRGRDIVAVLLAVVLTRMAWRTSSQEDTSDALSASLRLAFYTPGRLSAPLDVDGDGDSEALVVATMSTSGTQQWSLQVQDLTPMHHYSFKAAGAPFIPNVLVSSSELHVDSTADTTLSPLQMKTGQLLLHHHKRIPHQHKHNFVPSDDRTRHYFCGKDWHDASQRCGQPCPTGDSTNCPAGETCFADTPCDSSTTAQQQEQQEFDEELHAILFRNTTMTTPLGGLPSVATLWSDGGLTLHTLTTTDDKELVLKFLWGITLPHVLEDAHVTFVGAQDVVINDKSNLGRHGLILVGGSYLQDGMEERTSVLYSVDALTGKYMWDTLPSSDANNTTSSNTTAKDSTPLLPLQRGTSSAARRRSNIVSWRESENNLKHGESSSMSNMPNCLLAFRHSLLSSSRFGALPYAYWGPPDAKALLLHLDRQNARPHQHHRVAKKHEQAKVQQATKKNKATKKQQRKKNKQHQPVYGRPNVILTHTQDGIHIRSLKNGRALCHLSLLDKVLYADLNRDGSLDSVQIITDHIQDVSQHDNEWITELARQVEIEEERKTHRPRRLIRTNRLCHILGLSGMPPREELFAANLCGAIGNRDSIALEPAPPLVVDGTDVVVALNNGMIRRYNAPTGRNQWSHNLASIPDFPKWTNSTPTAYLTALDMASAAPRPILWTGENSMMLLSPGRGNVMAHAVFPQLIVARPQLADVSGDGTADVIVQSADAVFGYQVVVHAGTSILFRVLVGLLLMSMALALLRNRFQQRNGADKRSTDVQ